MKITQDVCDYAAEHGMNEERALQEGMKEKAAAFVASGGEIYQGDRLAGTNHDH